MCLEATSRSMRGYKNYGCPARARFKQSTGKLDNE
jgi:hypothetical protein